MLLRRQCSPGGDCRNTFGVRREARSDPGWYRYVTGLGAPWSQRRSELVTILPKA